MNWSAILAGVIHGVKVLGWVAASAVISFLISNGLDTIIPHFSANWPWLVLIVNPVLAGIKKWLDERPQA